MILVLLATLAQDPLAVRADTVPLRHDALHYDVYVYLFPSGPRVGMNVRARWRITSPDPIRLDLDTVFNIVATQVNGRTVEARRNGFALLLPHGARPGDTVTTAVLYGGAPRDGLVVRGEGAARTVFSDNWPDRARGWLVAQNHPADKATVRWDVKAPLGLTVVANGALRVADTAGPAVFWSFEMAEPIPVHTMVIGAARFAVTRLPPACAVRCVPQSVYSYPQDSAFAIDGPFKHATEIVDLLSRRFGPFPYGELRHVQSSTMFGGMENSTAIFYSDRAWSAHRMDDGLVAHETAHQWFGDAVSQDDWHHLWLSEGFATYGAALWAEHAGGPERLAQVMQQAAQAVRRSDVRNRPILDSSATDLMSLLNPNNYQKGSWVLHSLRGLVGDSAFFQGLRTFYERYRHGNALSRDFARVMEAAAGRDLEWFFRQALTQPGYPVLQVVTRREGDSVTVEVAQVQDGTWGVFRIPGLVLELNGQRVTLDVDGRTTRKAFSLRGSGVPALKVDPDSWWLLEVREAGQP